VIEKSIARMAHVGRIATALALVLSFVSLSSESVLSTVWPGCVEKRVEYTGGFNYVSGYRFTSEGCSQWCKSSGTKCNR
jgi:hypothetical protein